MKSSRTDAEQREDRGRTWREFRGLIACWFGLHPAPVLIIGSHTFECRRCRRSWSD